MNCSLSLDGQIEESSSSIQRNEEETFTETLSLGYHSWNISCTDILGNIGTSNTRDLRIISGGSGSCTNSLTEPCTASNTCQGTKICINRQWGSCTTNLQKCNDGLCKTECGTQVCTPIWTCGAWSSCENNENTRECIDENNCGTNNGRPLELKTCTSGGENSLLTWAIVIGVIVFVIVILLILLIVLLRRKEDSQSNVRVISGSS